MADPSVIFPPSLPSPQEGHWKKYNQRRFIIFVSSPVHHQRFKRIFVRADLLLARNRMLLGDPFVPFRLFSDAKPCDINGRLLVFSSAPLYIGSLSPVNCVHLTLPKRCFLSFSPLEALVFALIGDGLGAYFASRQLAPWSQPQRQEGSTSISTDARGD